MTPRTAPDRFSGRNEGPSNGRPPVSTLTRHLICWSPALLWAGLIFYLSAQTWVDAPVRFLINDKVAHFLLFAVFGITLAWAGRNLTRTRLQIGLVLFGILYAALDEVHQAFVPLRAFEKQKIGH
jgi:VanZ family protein